jgi:hypothetical protein
MASVLLLLQVNDEILTHGFTYTTEINDLPVSFSKVRKSINFRLLRLGDMSNELSTWSHSWRFEDQLKCEK